MRDTVHTQLTVQAQALLRIASSLERIEKKLTPWAKWFGKQ